MRRIVWTILAFTLVAVLVAPPAVLGQDNDSPVMVVGQHSITVQKTGSGAADRTMVREMVHYSLEEGSGPYEGDLHFSLDPQSSLSAWFMTRDGTPMPGEAGRVHNEMPSSSQNGLERHTLNLGSHNISFEEGHTYGITLIYTLPGDDMVFERGIDNPTPQPFLVVQSMPGLEPQSDDFTLRAVANTWTYNIVADDPTVFMPNEVLRFTFVEVEEPRTPLVATVDATGTEPVRLRVTADGGIPPYQFSWDTTGDGTCDDAEGETVTLDRQDPGRYTVTACVVDARGAEYRQTYETLTLEGREVALGPAGWLMALVGLLIGALLVYGLVTGGVIATTGRGRAPQTSSTGRSLGAESKDMLTLRQRVMVASLKELEIAKKKGEISENLYTPLKAELKQDTVRVMRELEKRKDETI